MTVNHWPDIVRPYERARVTIRVNRGSIVVIAKRDLLRTTSNAVRERPGPRITQRDLNNASSGGAGQHRRKADAFSTIFLCDVRSSGTGYAPISDAGTQCRVAVQYASELCRFYYTPSLMTRATRPL
jgi:hypothetical protein